MVVQSHRLVPSSGTWQRGNIAFASWGDVFRAYIARRWAPAIADPRALSQGSVWFSNDFRFLWTVLFSFQASALCGTGEAGQRGVAGAGYLDMLSSRSIYWTVGVSSEPSKGIFGGGDFSFLIIIGEVVWWGLLQGEHGCIILSSKEDGLVRD